jgi:hypothetical protein
MMNSFISWRSVLILLFVLNCRAIYAQHVDVRAGFIGDSVRVGQEISFYLTARYAKKDQVVFPDSTFSFSPFELKKKDYFPTRSRDTTSYDSAVYILRTFEVEQKQTLRLPVFVVNALDCTRVFSKRDTIALSLIVKRLPDSLTANLPLKASTAYQHVPQEINTPLIMIIVCFLAVLAAIGWVVFGPAISRHYRIKKLRRIHNEFSLTFDQYLKSIQSGFSPATTEAAVVQWKEYMEQISRRPYTKLTTRETTQMEKDEMLGKNLRVVDRAIYGAMDTNVVDSLQSLKSYADQRFNHVITEVKNG